MDYEEKILKIMRRDKVKKTMDILREIEPDFTYSQKTEFMRGLKKARKKEIMKISVKPEDFPYLKLKEPVEYNILKSRNMGIMKEIWKAFFSEIVIRSFSPVPSITEELKEELFNTMMEGIDLVKMNEKNLPEYFKKMRTNLKDWIIQKF